MRRQPQPEASPETKAAALALLEQNKGNLKKTALELGMSRSTLRGWAGRMTQRSRAVMHKDTAEEELGELAGKWQSILKRGTEIVQAAMDALTPEEIHQLKAKDIRELTVSSAVATEKMQLLRGRPTQQLAVQDLASFLKNSTETGTGAAPAAAPAPLHVLRRDKASSL